jgi:3-dehydroquinate dehydratase type I
VICVPITAESTGAAIEMMERAAPLADLFEFRLDRMRNPEMERLLGAARTPVIVTNRRRDEGGGFSGTEEERVAFLVEAARLGADYVDIETETAPVLKEALRRVCARGKTKRIASWHDFSGTPTAAMLKKKLAACMADGPDIVKIVTHARDAADGLRILELIPYARQNGQAIIAFCMGETGRISRIMAPLLGSVISYAPLEPEEASAPGQLTARRMREILRVLQDLVPAAAEYPFETHLPGRRSAKEGRAIAREFE